MTKCKMRINSLSIAPGTQEVTLDASAVITGSEENKEFFAYTPSGSLNLSTVNPKAVEGLAKGDEIYVTIEKAKKEEEAGGGE